jgi:two-component system nitrogen regulation sensor histidine kinase NtrY
MKLKIKFLLIIGLLHCICLVLSFFIFRENKLVFISSEALIILSAILSIGLYTQLIAPLDSLKAGANAIRDRDFNVKFITTGQNEMDELITVYNQMIDELRAERLKQEEQHFFLEKLINTSPTGILIMDYDQQLKQVNPKAADILAAGPETFLAEMISMPAGSSRVIKIGGVKAYKVQKSNFIDRGFARVFIMLEDFTDELFAAEKNVYGKVIRMMAHEVNNTVGPVNSIINLALGTEELWLPAERAVLKNAMQVAVDRNQNLNHFMRNYADLVKLPAVNKQQIDLVNLLRSVADFMEQKAKENGVVFHLRLPDHSVPLFADVQQMEQALINIVKNGIEAIDREGRLEFELDMAKHCLTIADSGAGISEEGKEKLFTPFYSTKKDGQGIGLTMVREILLNHGFDFSLETITPGRTEFRILLR